MGHLKKCKQVDDGLSFQPVFLGLRGWQLSQKDLGNGTKPWIGVDQQASHAGYDLGLRTWALAYCIRTQSLVVPIEVDHSQWQSEENFYRLSTGHGGRRWSQEVAKPSYKGLCLLNYKRGIFLP